MSLFVPLPFDIIALVAEATIADFFALGDLTVSRPRPGQRQLAWASAEDVSSASILRS
jgi:hypothetical protein